MGRRLELFQPIRIMPVEPYTLVEEVSLSQKDLYIIDYLLEWGNQPTHEAGIAKGVTLKDRSGRTIRSITRKHVGDRCRYLEEMGILEHVSRKPPRGAYSRTPHYYLSERIEAFQTLVNVYLDKENVMRKLTFMQSSYAESAIERNLAGMLIRFLVPEEKDRMYTAFLLHLISRKLQRDLGESGGDEILEDVQAESSEEDATRDMGAVVLRRLREILDSLTVEETESEILSLYGEVNVFTEDQKDTYRSILRLSPTALHLLVFLPFPELLNQYEDLGFIRLFEYGGGSSEKAKEQAREFRLLNRIIYELLYCSMISDMLMYPFLMMRVDKQLLFKDVIRKAERYGVPHDSFFSPKRMRKAHRLGDREKKGAMKRHIRAFKEL